MAKKINQIEKQIKNPGATYPVFMLLTEPQIYSFENIWPSRPMLLEEATFLIKKVTGELLLKRFEEQYKQEELSSAFPNLDPQFHIRVQLFCRKVNKLLEPKNLSEIYSLMLRDEWSISQKYFDNHFGRMLEGFWEEVPENFNEKDGPILK